MFYRSGRRLLNSSPGPVSAKQWLRMCVTYWLCILTVSLAAVGAADPSGTAFGDAVWRLFCFLSPPSRVAADGAPLPGDTDSETETWCCKPGNQNPGEEVRTSRGRVPCLMSWMPHIFFLPEWWYAGGRIVGALNSRGTTPPLVQCRTERF